MQCMAGVNKKMGGGGAKGCIRREGGAVWNPKVHEQKIAQINISFCKSDFPTEICVRAGGGGGYLPPSSNESLGLGS